MRIRHAMKKTLITKSGLKKTSRALPVFKYDIETSVTFLLSCAKRKQFVSFIEFNRFYKIPDQDWPLVYPLLYRHLNLVLKYCYENNLPPLSVLVVARDMKANGQMPQRQITRLIKAFIRYGCHKSENISDVRDMDDLHILQELCFKRAIDINFMPQKTLDAISQSIR